VDLDCARKIDESASIFVRRMQIVMSGRVQLKDDG